MVRLWGEGKPVGNRVVWVRYRGVLLSMWNAECFQSVISRVGNLVEIDESNLNGESLEYARLRVRSVVSFKIDIHEDIKINNIMCQVSVIEETSMDANDVYRRWWTKGKPTDSGSSINTIVGDTIQGDEED